MENITLDLTHIEIEGMSRLLLWGEDEGDIQFKVRVPINQFENPEDDFSDTLGINADVLRPYPHDSGFGCQRIIKAFDVDVYKIFGGGDRTGGYRKYIGCVDELKCS